MLNEVDLLGGRGAVAGQLSGQTSARVMASMLGGAAPEKPSVIGQFPVAVGEYLVAIGGCNDCHTVGWNQRRHTGRRAPHPGSAAGRNGPWGTSFATDLRPLAQTMTADAWVPQGAG